jgi:signal recognition particle GTPase
MSLVCEHCSKIYSTKGNLIKHQLTARFCLKLQNKKLDRIFNCEDCTYYTGRKDYLTTHIKTCKNKKKKESMDLKDCILQLALKDQHLKIQQGIIEELKKEAFKPKTTNNNNDNIIYNVQMEYCKQYLAPYKEVPKIHLDTF